MTLVEFIEFRVGKEASDLLLSSTTHSDLFSLLLLILEVVGKVSTFSFFPTDSRVLLDLLLDSLGFVPLVDFLSPLDFVSVVEGNFLLIVYVLLPAPSFSTTSSIRNI